MTGAARGGSPELPRVGVVIPCHNGVDDTLECLAPLLRSDYLKFGVIGVDDGSGGGTPDRMREAQRESRV